MLKYKTYDKEISAGEWDGFVLNVDAKGLWGFFFDWLRLKARFINTFGLLTSQGSLKMAMKP